VIVVYLNDKKILLQRGMKVKHALTADQLRDVRAGRKEVRDRGGRLVGLEGSLAEGAHLYIWQGEPDPDGANPP
jgi:hypothetical protein